MTSVYFLYVGTVVGHHMIYKNSAPAKSDMESELESFKIPMKSAVELAQLGCETPSSLGLAFDKDSELSGSSNSSCTLFNTIPSTS
jgi:hypothetical protein